MLFNEAEEDGLDGEMKEEEEFVGGCMDPIMVQKNE